MNKDFTFRNYFTYVLRYWIILAVCAVIGLGGGMAYGALNTNSEIIIYEGGVVVGGFGEFAEILSEISEKPEDLYNTVRSDAFSNMKAEFLKRKLYAAVEDEWRSFEKNNMLSEVKAKELFFDAFSVSSSGNVLYVSFSMETVFVSERESFAIKTVQKYIDLAYDYARTIDSMLARGENTLSKMELYSDIKGDKTGMGMLKGGLIGIVAGVIVGLIVALIMYFADKRINSYGEIAAFTGRKLLGATVGTVTNKVCPLIDREMKESKVLLVCGSADSVKRTAVLYSEYLPNADFKCLRIDVDNDANQSDSDLLGDYLRGGKLQDCIVKADGYDVMSGQQSWALMLKNADKISKLKSEYDRVIIAAAFGGDGSYGVLGEICDKILFAIDQKKTRGESVLSASVELNAPEKLIGAVLENTGKSYVGGSIYVINKEDE